LNELFLNYSTDRLQLSDTNDPTQTSAIQYIIRSLTGTIVNTLDHFHHNFLDARSWRRIAGAQVVWQSE